MLVAVNMGYT
ncbi:Protein of unknown function [Bacillus wiedmannii]|uniref:Uncharacterized protein n=1 Tax=Bacillus wiedmannii TaxID=1890302 RepID=A0A1C4E8L7_9BACI|nr:Protein of unknown function [Bacillus wiedmannii]SCM00344.1 Protein of unknown function [Bacillus wiedmannii]